MTKWQSLPFWLFALNGWSQRASSPVKTVTQRPPFGFVKEMGAILGDVVSPAVLESDWEVLQ